MSDVELLREFALSGSEAAFSQLVRRHVGAVYSICWRRLHDAHLAEDATQAVFLILARKARSVRREVLLKGWLHHTASYVSANLHRAEQARRRREMPFCQDVPQAGERGLSADDAAIEALELASAIDGALARLRARDRDAILLRFYEGRSFREVGHALSISEDAAKKRVTRGLDRLRQLVNPGRGAGISAVAVIDLLSRMGHEQIGKATAHEALVESLGRGGSISRRPMQLAKEMVTMMFRRQLQLIAATCLGGVVAAGGATLVVKSIARNGAIRIADPAPPQSAPAPAPMDRTLPQIKFDGVAASDVFDFLKDVSGIAFMPDWPALEKAGVKPNTPLTADYDNINLRQLVRILLWDLARPGKLEYQVAGKRLAISTSQVLKLPKAVGNSSDDAAIQKTLDQQLNDLKLDQHTFAAVLRQVQQKSSLPIWVDWEMLKKAGVEPDTRVTVPAVVEPTAGKLIDALLDAAKSTTPLARDIREGIVVISTPDALKEIQKLPRLEHDRNPL